MIKMDNKLKEIVVISNSPARDILEFVEYCDFYIDTYKSNEILLKNGMILKFRPSYNLDGIRKYYHYHEIFATFLKKESRRLKRQHDKINKSQSNWNSLRDFINDWIKDLENQRESVEGTDLFENHALVILDDIKTRMNELGENDR